MQLPSQTTAAFNGNSIAGRSFMILMVTFGIIIVLSLVAVGIDIVAGANTGPIQHAMDLIGIGGPSTATSNAGFDALARWRNPGSMAMAGPGGGGGLTLTPGGPPG